MFICLWISRIRCCCCYFSFNILCHFTLGFFLADRKFNINVILKNPPFYAIIISVIFLYFKIKLPVLYENTTFLLMYATIFLILMSLGIALTRFKVFSFKKAYFINWKSYIRSILVLININILI